MKKRWSYATTKKNTLYMIIINNTRFRWWWSKHRIQVHWTDRWYNDDADDDENYQVQSSTIIFGHHIILSYFCHDIHKPKPIPYSGTFLYITTSHSNKINLIYNMMTHRSQCSMFELINQIRMFSNDSYCFRVWYRLALTTHFFVVCWICTCFVCGVYIFYFIFSAYKFSKNT